jgi:deoxyadenosine/deoxycytidine kinase
VATDSLISDGDTPRRPRLIAVEGPLGVGKTTLARRLAHSFGHQLLLEAPEQNPFLERFYRNPRQAALATQLFFLFQRTQQLQDLRQADLFAPAQVADFLIAKDRLFARVNLDPNEYILYDKVYQQLTIDAPLPDLVIYLQAPTDVLISRIQQRGIDYEQGIERGYLDRINAAYSEFFLYYDEAPLLIVNAAQIDFANSERDFQQLAERALAVRSGRHYFNPSFFAPPR